MKGAAMSWFLFALLSTMAFSEEDLRFPPVPTCRGA
jgi:hypothetical protein